MKRNFRYFLYLFTFVVLGLELTLRMLGYEPGTFRRHDGFTEVEELIEYKNFTNDDFGVYRFSSWISDSIPVCLERNGFELFRVIDYLEEVNWVDDIDYIWQTAGCLMSIERGANCEIEDDEDWEAPFPRLIESLLHEKSSTNTFDSLLLDYARLPFNADGFRSISFHPYSTNRKKVLILGDSFAYGMTARPYFNSFPDYLLAMGYLVYNTGIPGVDPAQYAVVVDEYLERLNPDVVIVNLYIGNDLMPFPRIPHPDRPHEHMTNAGFFTSSPLGTYLSPQEAYSYYLSLQKIPTDTESHVTRICSKSAILSIIWGSGYKLEGYGHPALDDYNEAQSAISEAARLSNTTPHLQQIKARCDSFKIPVLHCIIPDRSDTSGNHDVYYRTDPELLSKLFKEMPYHEPENIVTSDFYGADDYHFSNKGHEKYAAFLDSLIRIIAPL
jgi:hypothetical protein